MFNSEQIKVIMILFLMNILGAVFAVPRLVNDWSQLNYSSTHKFVEISREKATRNQIWSLYTKKNLNSPHYKTKYYTKSEYHPDDKSGFNKEHLALYNPQGQKYWSKEKKEDYGFIVAAKTDVAVFINYDNINSVVWFDKSGSELNRIDFEDKNIVSKAKPLKNGKYWVIITEISDDPINPKTIDKETNLLSLIFTDGRGNILSQNKLKYPNLLYTVTINESNETLMCCSVENFNNGREKVYSYLFKYDGKLIKEFADKNITGGLFSEDNKLYFAVRRLYDMTTNEFITYLPAMGDCMPANKGVDILVASEWDDLRIINYKTKELYFYKEFDNDKTANDVGSINISGDGTIVRAIVGEYLYTYELVENE